MPIPNVASLYQKLHKGAEGGLEFERFIKLLLIADYNQRGEKINAESGASGDYKCVDAYTPGREEYIPGLNTSYQIKFYPSKLSAKHKKEVEISIKKALAENEYIHYLIIVTPEDFIKEDQEWFDGLRMEYNNKYSISGDFGYIAYTFDLSHWGHSRIIELALRFDSLGYHYFPELYPVGVGKFKLVKASIDCDICDWLPDNSSKNQFNQWFPYSRPELPPDPVFDFHFTNSSPEIFLLQKIDIEVFDIRSSLSGIPVDHFLKSLGTFEYEIDFTKPINTFTLDDPLIFEANKPMRFKIQLREFSKKCPGNSCDIKFWFHFDNYSLPSNTFHLSF